MKEEEEAAVAGEDGTEAEVGRRAKINKKQTKGPTEQNRRKQKTDSKTW